MSVLFESLPKSILVVFVITTIITCVGFAHLIWLMKKSKRK